MATQIAGTSLRLANYGTYVFRAAANLPATTSGNLFSVSGPVLVTSINGIVTTAIQAQACLIKLEAFLTSAAAATDLSLATGTDAASQGVGKLFGITGTPSVAGQFGYGVVQNNELIVNGPGFIRLNTSATNTGQMSWALTYIPLVAGAAVAAV